MSKTILVADDSKTIQHVVQLTFHTTGFRVVPAGSADEALAALKKERPDVVLADVTMPGTDGYAFCDALKRNAETSTIPVLLLAGAFEPFDERKAQAARADGHLRKPFDSQTLIDRVKALTGVPVEAPAPMSFAATLQAKQDPRPAPAPPAPIAIAVAAPVSRAPQVNDLAPPPVTPPPPAPRASPLLSPSPFGAPRVEAAPLRAAAPEPVRTSVPIEPAELDGDEFSFAGDGGSLPAGPSLEPPPPPDGGEQAANVDMWALADEPRAGAAKVAHGAPVSNSAWQNEDSSGGVETIEEIEIDDPSLSAPAPVATLPRAAPVAPVAPMAARERVEVPATSFRVESSWSQQPAAESWSEDPTAESPEPPPAAQQEAWQSAEAGEENWNQQPVAEGEAGWNEQNPQAWEEQSESEMHAEGWGSGEPAAPAPARRDLAEMVVQTAEHVADTAHSVVPGLPREELVMMARDIIERIAWEVVPELAETLIQAEIQRLLKR